MATDNPTQVVSAWLASFGAALEEGNFGAAVSLFGDSCFWRDLVSFTWNIKTAEGKDEIRAMLEATLPAVRPTNWQLAGEAMDIFGTVDAFFTFETAIARCGGHLRLADGKCFTLLTQMRELNGFEPAPTPKPFLKAADVTPQQPNPANPDTTSTEPKKPDAESAGMTQQPYVLILGASQSGVMLAAHLTRLGVPTLLVDRHAAPGDAWRKRYPSLKLHTPCIHDHFPFVPYPEDWPLYPSKDEFADWIASYSKLMGIKFWGSSPVESAEFNEETQEWTVTIPRPGGKTAVVHPKHLVFATGMYGEPRIPEFEGASCFQGRQYHSVEHPGGAESGVSDVSFKGKKCIVVGSNTSGHDICADLYERGGDITMIQRSPTIIIRSSTYRELYAEPLFAKSAPFSHQQADTLAAATPYRLLGVFQMPLAQEAQKRDADLHERLQKVGFQMHYGADGSGWLPQLLRAGGGYYYEVGCSELIATGQVAVRPGSIRRIKERSVELTDGSELPADVIVYATGYTPLTHIVAKVTSPELAARVGPIGGYGSGLAGDKGPWEGELRNLWKPTRQQGLWYHSTAVSLSRIYSPFLALQLKARWEGLPTPVYGMPGAAPEE